MNPETTKEHGRGSDAAFSAWLARVIAFARSNGVMWALEAETIEDLRAMFDMCMSPRETLTELTTE